MKIKRFAASLAAVSILLCACGKKDDKEKKAKLSKDTSDVTSAVSDETDAADSKDVKDATDSTKSADDTEPTESEFKPAFDLDKDLYAFYGDDSYKLHSRLTCVLSLLTSWSTILDLDVEDKTFQGEYTSATGKIDGDGYDCLECNFNGTIDGFTRVNAYSFSTHVTKFETKKFEPREEKYMDSPATVTYSDPYGFMEPDELILYLPNAPVAEIPKEVTEWIEMNAEFSDTLDNYVLYNPKDATAFLVSADTFSSKTRQVTASDLDKLPESMLDKHNGVTVSFDKTSLTASLKRGNAEYKDLHICGSQNREDILYLYGSNNHGHTVILQIAPGEKIMTVLESNDPELAAGTLITLS
ncbi:MAG: hypothetical protein K6E26_10865 [Clostridiales bacterium]|nr:hypothetical protein [Clostridiales bacterium]